MKKEQKQTSFSLKKEKLSNKQNPRFILTYSIKKKRITAHAVILFIELVISNLRELKLHSLINDFS